MDHHYDHTKLSHSKFLDRYTRSSVSLVFVYGDDFSRRPILRNFYKMLASGWCYIIFIVMVMAILFFLRHRDLDRENVYLSMYVDVVITLTSASSLHYNNHLEKVFFAILLLGAFLINTIALDNFLFYTFLTEESYHMDSLIKYAEFNSPTIQIDDRHVEWFKYNDYNKYFER